ncbi:MAG: MFS transporter [Anaerolineae bacterium]|nr:MFS transporter [Anaerolineae bacterium]
MATSVMSTREPVSADLRRNFFHLYADIGWYGVLSGTSLAFVAIYATRMGATGFQIGLLNAAPALTALAMSLPAGRWLAHRPIDRAVFWTSVGHRIFYLPWVFIPLLLVPSQQIWGLIGLTFIMSIPGVALAVGFNGLFATAVPDEWRGHVVGVRNAVLAAAMIIVSLLSGTILNRWPDAYPLIFAIGFFGALMSSVHLYLIRPNSAEQPTHPTAKKTWHMDWGHPGAPRHWSGLRTAVGTRFFINGRTVRERLTPTILRGHYGKSMALLFGFHFTQYLAIPLFPLVVVRVLDLSDQTYGLGNVFFYVSVLIGSTQIASLSTRWGYRRTLAVGTVGMCLYPIMVGLSHDTTLYLVTSLVGGLVWALVSGTLSNYLLDQTPSHNRPPYLAWYNLILYTAVLAGSLLGPEIAKVIGLTQALFTIAALRLVAGLFFWRWG